MNALITSKNDNPTMSSREIAELVEARHNDVVATIDRLFDKGLLRSNRKSRREATGGRPVDVYDLCERDTYLVVAGYSDEHRARVIDRWQELEATVSRPMDPMKALNDPAAMRGLLLTYTERVIELETTVAEQAPKVAALDRIATHSDGSFCIRDAAKTLQIREKDLKQLLTERKWVYRRPMGGTLLAYAERLQQGYMEHKVECGEKSDGSEWTRTQARITAKGMARLSEILAERSFPMAAGMN